MKCIYRLLLVLASASFFYASAQAQNAGTVSNHAIPIGKGAGVQGFGSLALTSGQVIIGQSSADPQAKTLTGDVTVDNTGTTAIGANKVTNSQLATMLANTTKCNATAGTANPTDCNASTMRINLGLVIGTNVQAWDADLDCIAAISSTGVISRTGAGTCSAGALALSGLATGTQDTVVGYFGSTTASAAAVPNCTGALNYSTGTHTFGCGLASPVIASRATAAATDLSAFSAIQTLGYSTAGDGGGATFKKVGSTAFRDSYVVSPTITGNGTGSCTNGTYRNVQPSGGTGTNLILTVTVSGNVVTAVALAGTGGNGYTTNDTVSTSITGCSSTVTFSVGTVSTPSGSFTDSAGNHWQIVPDQGNFINVRQFGAKLDYAGTDATATNDYTSIQNAISYCSDIHSPTIDGGGSAGCKVIVPAGNALICGSVPLEVPQGVALEGVNMWASTLKMCSAWGSGVTFLNICNPNTHAACFASMLRNLTLYSAYTQSSSSNSSMVYSNNIQQVDAFDRVAIYSGQRECLRLETGYGGAALLGVQNLECTPGASTVNAGILINYGTTLVTMRNVHVENGGPTTTSGIRITGGFVDIVGFHTEGISTGIEVNIPTATTNGVVRIHTISGGASCTYLVLRQTGSVANSVVLGQAVPNGCTNTYINAGSVSGAIVQVDDIKF